MQSHRFAQQRDETSHQLRSGWGRSSWAQRGWARLAGFAVSVFLGSVAAIANASVAKGEQSAGDEITAGNGWLMPKDVSLEGWRIDQLIIVTGIFTTILFIIMCIWMAVACIKHGKNHKAVYDHGHAPKQVAFALALSSVIFFVVDGNLWVNSTIDTNNVYWNFDIPNKDPKVVRVQVNARQWAWDIRYAGPDGKFNTIDDIVTTNDMRVPVDAPVIVQLASVDVIHSFYLPHLRVKLDAVPGEVNQLWFQSTETGKFELGCAQHCGVAHYKMIGLLTVLSQDDYADWAAHASANSARAYDPKDMTAHWGWDWEKGIK